MPVQYETYARRLLHHLLDATHLSAARTWGSVQVELLARVRRIGGTAEVFPRPSGQGIQARIPVVTPEGATTTQDVRFLGRNGPGWLLRGTITAQKPLRSVLTPGHVQFSTQRPSSTCLVLNQAAPSWACCAPRAKHLQPDRQRPRGRVGRSAASVAPANIPARLVT
ncbi:DUF3710 domain-containing protein [Streptomyces sp. NPDC057910]|uniref:DUF3710 domain-containing protein n=1 Tax=Streptomyces sp. NPDC057910 TaxID=3346278 RepID=UPI0036F085DF